MVTKKVERVCERCGAMFFVLFPSAPQRFCGRPCGQASAAEKNRRPLAQRFWKKIDKNGPIPAYRPDLGPCWLWKGTLTEKGYGKLTYSLYDDQHKKWVRPAQFAHRLAYELLVGPIPAGRELDHLCRNRGCVNPEHLEPVSHHTNVLRGAVYKPLRCRRGHERTPENTHTSPNGTRRRCRICMKESSQRVYVERKKARKEHVSGD